MSIVKPGMVLLLREQHRLWPHWMWYDDRLVDPDRTVILSTPIVPEGEIVCVLDTLKGGRTNGWAALVMWSGEIGCLFSQDTHVEPLF